MDSERAERMVSALRKREVMAHVVQAGVYEFGIRVVLDEGIEALWDVDGAAGLDAEIVSEGVLIGFVPHVPGSEGFAESQLVDTIASTVYSPEGLLPPTAPSTVSPWEGHVPTVSALPAHGAGHPPPLSRHRRRAHWIWRGRK